MVIVTNVGFIIAEVPKVSLERANNKTWELHHMGTIVSYKSYQTDALISFIIENLIILLRVLIQKLVLSRLK